MTDTDRLRHLLLMLSSPYDGEIVTAAKAVGSFLKKQGSDWHELVDRLTVPAEPQPHSAPRYDDEAELFDHVAAAQVVARDAHGSTA